MKTLAILLLFSRLGFGQAPVIFDTDMGNDIDDALALAMLHSLSDRGECKLIGVTLTNANPSAVPYVRMVNRFYGRGSLPVGTAIRAVSDGDHDNYLGAALRSAPNAYRNGTPPSAESAVHLLRRLLAASAQRVIVVQVGFSTNLAALLDSPGDELSPLDGMDLVRQKVASLSAMAGNFAEPKAEYNVKLDADAARHVFDAWPSPVLVSGFEIGRDLLYPAHSIEQDFAYTSWHPVAVSYHAYSKMPYDRPTWDLTAVLAAVRANRSYFELSPNGRVTVNDSGVTTFVAKGGQHRYLLLNPDQRQRIVEALTLLTSQPPARNGGM